MHSEGLVAMASAAIEFIQPNWSAPDSVRALCTTRIGGSSLSPYDSFNLATHVGDATNSVVLNRELLKRELNLSDEPCWLNQTHSADVAMLDGTRDYAIDSDAAICQKAGVTAVVMTADCLPILICNQQGDEVAAVHAGWRGLADGIILATLKKMRTPPEQLMAWIGPAISQPRFEVGDEVRSLFLNRYENAALRFKQNRPGHWLCDLPGLAVDQLHDLKATAVHQSGLCSFDDDSKFYSYRRENISGRMASLIWIKSEA